jgi:hypothetical protein
MKKECDRLVSDPRRPKKSNSFQRDHFIIPRHNNLPDNKPLFRAAIDRALAWALVDCALGRDYEHWLALARLWARLGEIGEGGAR